MNVRKQQMLTMREQVHTYAQIGEAFNISKQRVYQLIGESNANLFHPITEKQCVYPGIRRWMNDNQVHITELTRRLFGNASGNNFKRVSDWLRGSKTLYKRMIDRILYITELTYEEAFSYDE